MDAYESHLLHCRRKVWGSVYRPIWEQYSIPGAPVSVPCQVIPSGILQVERPLLEPERADDDRLEALKLFKVRRTSLDRSWEQHCSSLRAAAIRKWHGIICTCLTAFQLGRQWNKQEPLGVAICTDLRHVFAGKSTGTLHNRSGPVLRYIAWCSRFGVQPFPLTEQVAYDFMKYEAVKASSTFLRSFFVSVAFSLYVLGLTGADLVMQSSRITGLAREMYLRKRKLVQRRPLTVKIVKALEDFAQDDSKSLFDRVAAGCFLLCVYMRARFSDMIHMTAFKADELFIDGFLEGYIECSVTRSKSAYTTERKTQFLPMAAPRRGLSSGDWFASWQAASVASGKPRGEDVPNLPVPTEGGWSKVPLTASEGCTWLVSILKCCGFANEDLVNVGTHSCKSTCLSWCAKYGVPLDVRRHLGFHSVPGDKTAIVYSRDAAAGPLRHLDEVLRSIRAGTFDPDTTRSGYFRVAAAASSDQPADPVVSRQPVVVPDDPEVRSEVGSEDTESEDSQDEEDDESGKEAVEHALEVVAQPWGEHQPDASAREFPDADLFRHRQTRYIHVAADEGGARFRCGRDISERYVKLDVRPQFCSPQCRQCFRV